MNFINLIIIYLVGSLLSLIMVHLAFYFGVDPKRDGLTKKQAYIIAPLASWGVVISIIIGLFRRK